VKFPYGFWSTIKVLNVRPKHSIMCVIHNGHTINLVSTIDIYYKLVIVRGKNKIIKKCTSCYCKRKNLFLFFSFFNITLIMRNPKGISHDML